MRVSMALLLCMRRSHVLASRAIPAFFSHGVQGIATASAAASHSARPRSLVSMSSAAAAEAVAEVPTLDERLVAENPELIRANLRSRRASDEQLAAVDRIGELTAERSRLVAEGNKAREVRKKISPKIGALLKAGEVDAANELKAEVAAASEEASRLDGRVEVVETERTALFEALPNLLDPRTHDGDDEEANTVVSTWGVDGVDLPSGLRWHDELGAELGGLDVEAGAKLSGSRFSVLRGSLARLERALTNFFVDMHSTQHGYTEVAVPLLVGAQALRGTGQLPKFGDDLFKLAEPLNGREGYLIPTAEVPVTNIHAGQVLDESQLPLSYVAPTPCFRAEAGSHGKDVRGLFRQHQFQKVELVKIVTPEQADEQHHLLVSHAEACLQALGLPYRKVRLCSGDIGFSARLCYDLEVWLPGQGKFREISSCSNCADFQARRMGLRYRPAARGEKGKALKPRFCHTMNGSGLAVGRTLVALLETYQKDDGSVEVPEALRPYMGGMEVLLPE